MTDDKSLTEVYHDRNLLACALANMHEAGMAGWTPARDDDPEKWAIVWLSTPLGQMSWHVPREMAEGLVVRNDDYEYDGHTRETKNARLSAWCDEGCWF